MTDLTQSPELCWDHLYIPQADVITYWERRSVQIIGRLTKSERRRAIGMDAVGLTLIMLVGFAVFRIVGG